MSSFSPPARASACTRTLPRCCMRWRERRCFSPAPGPAPAGMQARPQLEAGVPTLILYGDVPLIRAATLKRLCAAAGAGMAVLTVELDDPQGYGRVVRGGGAASGGLL